MAYRHYERSPRFSELDNILVVPLFDRPVIWKFPAMQNPVEDYK